MKKIKIILFLFLLYSIYFSPVFASEVKMNKAEKVAINFLKEINKSPKSLIPVFEKKSSKNEVLYYVFNFSDSKGFIIISGEDSVYPILAYSSESSYNINDTKRKFN